MTGRPRSGTLPATPSFREASEACDRAARLVPNSPETYERLASLLVLSEQTREAATIVMLAGVAWIAGRSWWPRFGAFIVALDKHAGQEKWRTKRGLSRQAHVTPIVMQVDGRPQLISLDYGHRIAFAAMTPLGGNWICDRTWEFLKQRLGLQE